MREAFAQLAAALGIAPGFHDIRGLHQAMTEEGVQALAEALGHRAATPEEAAASLTALQAARGARTVRDYHIVGTGRPIELGLPARLPWSMVDLESGQSIAEGVGPRISDDGLPAGRYRLRLHGDAPEPGTLLLVRPERSPLDRLTGRGERRWGLMTALYGLRSRRNAGIGDYRDLAAFAAASGRAGAAFVGINPIHALRTGDAAWSSPYSPNHRGFWNTTHIALDAVPEFGRVGPARTILARQEAAINALRSASIVDYEAVEALRLPVLEALYEVFRQRPPRDPRVRRFEAFRTAGGEALERFATFESIADRYTPHIPAWPRELREVTAPAVERWREEHAERIRFHGWLQFVADEQIAAAARAGRDAGMDVGLYLDVAVGTVRGSAEVWALPDAFATGVSLGAPPDHFNPTGQTWDLAPLHPHRLMDADGEPLVTVLRAAMRHSGMIRIDHILGLNRSFWVPIDGRPGGYVYYPFDALLSLVAIESDRAGAIVVGEDLGLVPDGFRDRLAEERLLGCTVMQFERYGGEFVDPKHYRACSIGSVGSHDVPPLRGWWSASDIQAMVVAGLIDEAEAETMRADRTQARAALWRLLTGVGGLPGDPMAPPETLDVEAIRVCHALLAGAPPDFVALQLDDLLGIELQQNLPGTLRDVHPNWQRRLPVDLETLAQVPEWQATCRLLRTLRPRTAQGNSKVTA